MPWHIWGKIIMANETLLQTSVSQREALKSMWRNKMFNSITILEQNKVR